MNNPDAISMVHGTTSLWSRWTMGQQCLHGPDQRKYGADGRWTMDQWKYGQWINGNMVNGYKVQMNNGSINQWINVNTDNAYIVQMNNGSMELWSMSAWSRWTMDQWKYGQCLHGPIDQWKPRTHGSNASQKPMKNGGHKSLVSTIIITSSLWTMGPWSDGQRIKWINTT